MWICCDDEDWDEDDEAVKWEEEEDWEVMIDGKARKSQAKSRQRR